MAKIDLDCMSDMQFDVLKEIGNIGAGNATTALSKMLNIKVDMTVPKVELLPFADIASVVGKEDDIVVGIMVGIADDVNGMMMFIFDQKSAHHLVNSVMGRDVHTDENEDAHTFTEMDTSALMEIGNIVSGSYLNALAGLTGFKIISTVPSLTVDMLGAILSVPASEFGKYGDKLLMIQSEFGEDNFVTGYFLLIPELESYDTILSSLGM